MFHTLNFSYSGFLCIKTSYRNKLPASTVIGDKFCLQCIHSKDRLIDCLSAYRNFPPLPCYVQTVNVLALGYGCVHIVYRSNDNNDITQKKAI